jgi:hypothetical protein
VALALELLEGRNLLSGNPWPSGLVPQTASGTNHTLDQSDVLQLLPATTPGVQQAGAAGTLHNDTLNAGGVDWYQFTLTSASHVTLSTADGQGPAALVSVLTLYNTEAPDPNYPFDFNSPPYDPLGHRVLAQDDGAGHGGDASVSRDLAPGTYYVAVSGTGNNYFNVFLADSGYPGRTGAYKLLVTAADLGLSAAGPAVLAVEPATSADPTAIPAVASSPLVVRVDLSGPIDPTTVTLAQPGALPTDPPPTVQLTYNPTGNFGDGNDQTVILAGFHFSADAAELQLKPQGVLAPGFYRLVLAGDPQGGAVPVLMDPTDTLNLGQDATHAGQDFTAYFQIDGVEGRVGAQGPDDTPAGARDLGNVTSAGLLHVAGTIGDDPFAANPAAQVDLYHFQISGPGLYAVSAEVFAGRLGSTLEPGLSLFRVDPTNPTEPLQLVASNAGSGNATPATGGLPEPLLNDPVLFAGLPAGDYYLAVSGTGNVPGIGPNTDPGTNGIFDPNVSESGFNGFTSGDYVLNVLIQPALPAPHVVATTPAAGGTLTEPPTQITVRFDSTVNLAELANTAFNTISDTTVASVFVVGADGHTYFPRLESYDDATNIATFLMLDALPAGVNALHLSGALGLTGFGGNPLVGNDSSGDYVVRFTVAGPPRGTPGNPLVWTEQEPNDSLAAPQDLGVLFPNELLAGVTIQGSLTAGDVDYYQIQVLQDEVYRFTLTGPSGPGKEAGPAPAGVAMIVTDAAGNPLGLFPQGSANDLLGELPPGTYVLRVSGLPAGYEVHISLPSDTENPPPLTAGAPPALRIRLADTTTPPVTSPVPPPTAVSLPPSQNGPALPPPSLIALVNLTQFPVSGDLVDKGLVVIGGALPAFAGVPRDATLALRAAPVGGVTNGAATDPAAGANLVQVSGLESITIGLVSSSPQGGATGIDAPADYRSAVAALMPLWQGLVDRLFSAGNGRAVELIPVSLDVPVGAGVQEVFGQGCEQLGDVLLPEAEALAGPVARASQSSRPSEEGVRPTGWAWVAALLVGGLCGMTRSEARAADGETSARVRARQPVPNRRGPRNDAAP